MIARTVLLNLKTASRLNSLPLQHVFQSQKASISSQNYAITLANNAPMHTKDDIKVVLHGFSQLASRSDIDSYLGGIVAETDPILDERLLPSGQYVVTLPRSNESIQWLNTVGGKYKYKTVDAKGLTMMKHRGQSLASSRGITNCTVRFVNVASSINEEKLRIFLENYELDNSRQSMIRFDSQWRKKDKNAMITRRYIVHFSCPEEAQRATVELTNQYYDTLPVKLFWYQC